MENINLGEKVTVEKIGGDGAIRQRMLDMGIMPGVQIEVERKAPAGSPIWIKCNGMHLSLRLTEARAIEVVKI